MHWSYNSKRIGMMPVEKVCSIGSFRQSAYGFSFSIGIVSAEDDEYRWAGVEDPKVIVTTSHDPSSKLKQFSKVSRI